MLEKQCFICKKYTTDYSNNQLKKKVKRRCKKCIQEHNINHKQPPPKPQNSPTGQAQRRFEALITEVEKLKQENNRLRELLLQHENQCDKNIVSDDKSVPSYNGDITSDDESVSSYNGDITSSDEDITSGNNDTLSDDDKKYTIPLGTKIRQIDTNIIRQFSPYKKLELKNNGCIFSQDFYFLKETFGNGTGNFCNVIFRREVAKKYGCIPRCKDDTLDTDLSKIYKNMENNTENILSELWELSYGRNNLSTPPNNYSDFLPMINQLRNTNFSWLPQGSCKFIGRFSITSTNNTNSFVRSENPYLFVIGSTLIIYKFISPKHFRINNKILKCTILTYASMSSIGYNIPFIDSCILVNFSNGKVYTADLKYFTQKNRKKYMTDFIL